MPPKVGNFSGMQNRGKETRHEYGIDQSEPREIWGTDCIHLGHASPDQSLQELGQGCTTEKSGFDSRRKKQNLPFSTALRLAPRLLLASYPMDVHSEAERPRCEEVTTHFYQVRRLSMRGVMPPLSHSSARQNVRLYTIHRDSNGLRVACRYGVPGVLSSVVLAQRNLRPEARALTSMS